MLCLACGSFGFYAAAQSAPHYGPASPAGFAGPRRVVPLPIDVEELPRIAVVLTSHNHGETRAVEAGEA